MRVDELLQEQRIDFKVSGRDFLVKCLNPDHEDSNPSMRVDQVTGVFNCFACGGYMRYFGISVMVICRPLKATTLPVMSRTGKTNLPLNCVS